MCMIWYFFLFLAFLLCLGYLWQSILSRIFSIQEKGWPLWILGTGAGFLFLSFVLSIAIVWYRLTPIGLAIVYGIVSLISLFLYFFITRKAEVSKSNLPREENGFFFYKRLIVPVVYSIVWLYGLFLLFQNRSGEILQSPWQAISPRFILVYFVLTILLGVILFSQYKIKTLLLIIIAHTFLLHLYLPLSHQLPWGGDVWRHIAIEEQIQDDDFILPVLFGDQASWEQRPQKYSYSHMWGGAVALASTGLDFKTINIWMVPILWSILVPFLVYGIALTLFKSKRSAVVISALTIVPFTFQALGSLTLPVSFDFLTFLFFLFFWLKFLEEKNAWQRNIALALAVLMIFGYITYFILAWALIMFTFICWLLRRIQKQWVFSLGIGLLFVCGIYIFPFIEVIAGISTVYPHVDWVYTIKQSVGIFSGWFFAEQIRPHDIAIGNILFNHTPSIAHVSNMFTTWRWHISVFSLLFWIGAAIGWIKIILREKRFSWIGMSFLCSTVIAGYGIGWFFLEGDRLLVRRLDPLVALSIIFLFSYFFISIFHYFEKIPQRLQKAIVLVIILLASWFGTTTYASGPDMRVISKAEYSVAEEVWKKSDIYNSTYCVIADTWTLLALEGISGGKIKGGGFPMNYQFAQPELLMLVQEAKIQPVTTTLERGKVLTGAKECFIATPGQPLGKDSK